MAALGEDLLGVVNKLQDLVFNTIGNDSLDLPQIVCREPKAFCNQLHILILLRSSSVHNRPESLPS